MAEITPWNNAFNAGAGSVPSIPVQGMQLPSGDVSGANAFMNAMNAGRAASASRQNQAIQREQMDMQRQRFQYEMQQDMMKSIMAQREMAQNRLLGQHFANSIGEDGKPDYPALITSIAGDSNLLEKAPGVISSIVGLQKTTSEIAKNSLDMGIAKHKAISLAAGAAIQESKGGQVQLGMVVRGLAQLGAAGVLSREEIDEITNSLPKEGPELTAWANNAFNSAEQTAITMEAVRGKLQFHDIGGALLPIRSYNDGRQELSPGADGKPLLIEKTLTPGERYPMVQMEGPGDTQIPRRVDSLGGPMPGVGAAPVGAAPVGAEMPGVAPGVPGAAPAGAAAEPLRFPQTEEIIQARKATEGKFSEQYELMKTDTERTQAARDQLDKVHEALKTFKPGALMSSIRMPVGKGVREFINKDLGDAIAGGDVSAAEIMASEGAKSAFSVIKSLGVVNRDLSAPELRMSKEATFGPDMTPEAVEVMLKNAKAAIEYQDLKLKFMSWYLRGYKADPRTAIERNFDLDQAVNTFHQKLKSGEIAKNRTFSYPGEM